MAVVVSAKVHAELGAPRALKLVASSTQGVGAGEDALAPVAALQRLLASHGGFAREKLGLVEVSETSAAQAIALRDAFELEDDELCPDGGAVARGYPLGAAGAVSVVRLFTRMARNRGRHAPIYGAATQDALGGIGVAALFEAV